MGHQMTQMPLSRQNVRVWANSYAGAFDCLDYRGAPSATKSVCMSSTIIAVLDGSICRTCTAWGHLHR